MLSKIASSKIELSYFFLKFAMDSGNPSCQSPRRFCQTVILRGDQNEKICETLYFRFTGAVHVCSGPGLGPGLRTILGEWTQQQIRMGAFSHWRKQSIRVREHPARSNGSTKVQIPGIETPAIQGSRLGNAQAFSGRPIPRGNSAF